MKIKVSVALISSVISPSFLYFSVRYPYCHLQSLPSLPLLLILVVFFISFLYSVLSSFLPPSFSYFTFILSCPPLVPPPLSGCVLSPSALLWSYLHPGTWLQLITREERKKKAQFLSAATAAIHCRVVNEGERLIAPPSLSPSLLFPPFLHFLSMLSPTAGAFWTVKRPAFECPILNLLNSSSKL